MSETTWQRVKTVLAVVFFPVTLVVLLFVVWPRKVVGRYGNSGSTLEFARGVESKLRGIEQSDTDAAGRLGELERAVAASGVELDSLEGSIDNARDDAERIEQRTERAAELTRRSIDIIDELIRKRNGD